MGTVSKNRGMSCVGVRKTGTTLIRVSTVMGTLYYKNVRLEESKLGDNKVKLARKQYRGKGRYIDEILE